MTDLEADHAFLAEALGNGTDPRKAATSELESLCAAFVDVARELREVTLKCLETATPDPTLLASRERLTVAAWDAQDAVHAAQRRWMLKGVDIYIAHDRNGSPIRVDKQTHLPIVGFK